MAMKIEQVEDELESNRKVWPLIIMMRILFYLSGSLHIRNIITLCVKSGINFLIADAAFGGNAISI